MRYQDRQLTFLDGNGREGLVCVRVIQSSGNQPSGDEQSATVIVSALAENPGMSPCNAFEELAPQIAAAFGLHGDQLRYIEHWGPHSYEDQEREEEFSVVQFSYDPSGSNAHAPGAGRFYDPSWMRIDLVDVEEVIGGELPPSAILESRGGGVQKG